MSMSTPPGVQPLVILTDPINSLETERLRQASRVLQISPAKDEDFRQAARLADIIIVRSKLAEDLFDDTPGLKAVIRHGSGVDIIPVAAATRAGIVVTNVPGANAQSVAEYCLAAMFDAARNIGGIDQRMAGSGWEGARTLAAGTFELRGKRVGIVGLGAIGRALADMCLALGMSVSAYRHRPGAQAPAAVELKTMDALLEQSDFLCLCCPLTPETTGLLGAAELARAHSGLWLINVARAAVVDQDALLECLRLRALRGATLDVFHPTGEFRAACSALDQVRLTPHLAGLAREGIERMSKGAVDAALDVLAGRLPRDIVNPDVLQRPELRLAATAA